MSVDPNEVGPDPQVVERIARTLVPHWFVEGGKPRVKAGDLAVQAEARWWVHETLLLAADLGAVPRHGSAVAEDIAGDTLTLIRQALADRELWEAVALVTELEAKDEQGRVLREPPTAPMPVVDPLAARRVAREWRRDQ